MSNVSRWVVAALFVFAAGCGGGGPGKPKAYPVSGKVTVNGQALKDCTIQFSPLDPNGASYSATLGADGGYALSDPGDQVSGAAAGKYKVVLALTPEANRNAMMAQMKGAQGPTNTASAAPFPPEFGSATTSPREVEVKAETNTIDISIP